MPAVFLCPKLKFMALEWCVSDLHQASIEG